MQVTLSSLRPRNRPSVPFRSQTEAIPMVMDSGMKTMLGGAHRNTILLFYHPEAVQFDTLNTLRRHLLDATSQLRVMNLYSVNLSQNPHTTRWLHQLHAFEAPHGRVMPGLLYIQADKAHTLASSFPDVDPRTLSHVHASHNDLVGASAEKIYEMLRNDLSH